MSYHVGFIPDGDGGVLSFLQKSNSMLSPDEREVVGLLELQAFIEAKSVQLGEASIDEDLLCMVSQFAPIVEDQVSHSNYKERKCFQGAELYYIDVSDEF